VRLSGTYGEIAHFKLGTDVKDPSSAAADCLINSTRCSIRRLIVDLVVYLRYLKSTNEHCTLDLVQNFANLKH